MAIPVFVALLLCLAALPAFAQETSLFFQSLPEGVQTLLAEAYPGWAAPYGALLYEDYHAALVMLQKDGRSVAVLAEQTGDGYAIVAENDRLVPDSVPVDTQTWWIQDKNKDGHPYIWYDPDRENGLYLVFSEDADGTWRVDSGSFGDTSGFSENTLCFDVANQGTALRVCSESYFSAVYAPITVDLTFAAFDPEAVRAACAEIMTHKNDPMLIPSTMEADALPQGQVIDFPKGKKYPVYSGPGEDYRRLGDDGNATVSTNGWIQVFGREGNWLLIQYNIRDGRNRFGYITASALPGDADVPELNFTHKAGVLDGSATDDPLRTWAETERFENVDCEQLATFGDEVYIKIVTDTLKYRGFANGVTLREDHAGNAVVTAEGAALFADEALADELGTVSGGIELTVLQRTDAATQVRVGGNPCALEGWVRTDALLFGALVTDVEAESNLIALCGPQTDDPRDWYGYAAPSTDADRESMDEYPNYQALAQVNGFLLVQSERISATTVYIPADWAIPLPKDSVYTNGVVSVSLAQDAAVTVGPDPSSRQTVLLYKGVTVGVSLMGTVSLTVDPSLLPKSADIPTYGYLQTGAFGGGEADVPLPVGLLTPAGEADCLVLTAGLNGWDGCAYGYGTRLILLGETQRSYLVRTPTGECGFFDKTDVALTGQTATQEGYAALSYGTATLARAGEYRQRPYARSDELGSWPEGTQVTLLSDLGAWWCVLRDADTTAFLPADALTGLPGDAPVYEGVYNDFRDEPFAFTWGLTPPLFHTDTDAWLLLRDEQELLLSHRVYRDGAWTENGRTGALFGGDVRLLGDFGGNGERMTVELYVNDSNVDIGLTLNRSGEDWFLSSVRLTEYGQDDSYGATLLYDRLFSPADGGLTLTEDGQMRFLPLSEACETELTRLDAGALLTLCRQAYGDAGLMW